MVKGMASSRILRIVNHCLPNVPASQHGLENQQCSGDEVRTHFGINQKLCGKPEVLAKGYAKVRMLASEAMQADEQGLTHGGFYFGMADYAAMLAVNDPHVVLGSASAKFLKPVKTGDDLTAEARVLEIKGKKHLVEVKVARGKEDVFEGTFTCFVLEKHVLDK
eukprot:TRINITY_DN106649_c0_g1_i1.p1 TRINITY_DN106649_c0_g1~~TRINITY_DN106649_c0_g1_i1.p1  ORF type:complete len:164 (-),score=34.11 TRINITY_DN106649_c0_g1_i1:94-585(-)